MINKKVRDFNECFEALPKEVQSKAIETFKKWQTNPEQVEIKPLEKFDKDIYSCKINLRYRAMAKKIKNESGEDVFLWFWIGSHENYNNQLQRSLLNLKITQAREKAEYIKDKKQKILDYK